MTTPVRTLAPHITVNGSPLAGMWLNSLVDLRIDAGLRVGSRCLMRFSDAGYPLAMSAVFTLAAEVTVAVPDKGDLMTGEVTEATINQQAGEHPEFVITVDDLTHRLARTSRVQTFVDMTYDTIVAKIAQDAGLTPQVDSGTIVHPYVLQADTDLAFIDDLAHRAGCDWWVEGRTLHFAKPSADGAAITLRLGEDLLQFSVHASARHPDTVEVRGWDRDGQQAAQARSTVAQTQTPAASSDFVNAFINPTALGAATAVTGAATPMSSDEAQELADAAAGRWTASAVVARGSAHVDPSLKPGGTVKVEQAGPVSGTYHLTQVRHVFNAAGFETRFAAGERGPTTLVDTLAAPSRTASLYHPGLAVGTATNIDDPEKRGRVKVMLSGLSGEVESAWARVATLGAGKQRGMVFLPEVGDEVLVGFEGGDTRQPVVIGGLFGKSTTIPSWDVDQGTVTARRITSRLGHIIELGDGTGDAAQYLLFGLAGGEHRLRVGKDRIDLEAPAGVPLKITSGQAYFQISDSGEITIKGAKVTITADSDVAISGANAKLSAKSQLDVEGGATTVGGSMSTTVKSSGITAVKGSMVQLN